MLHHGHEEISILREARQFHPDISLLVISSNTEPSAVQRCFDAGATGYLDKFSTGCDSVVNAVKAVARGDRVFPPDILGSLLHASAQSDPGVPKLASLSARERQVLGYLAGGADNLKISICLKISERTVKAHVSSLYRKLGQENRTQLALYARQLGVRPPPDV
jgi:DNA-binding NarL/FixJ family response regulator